MARLTSDLKEKNYRDIHLAVVVEHVRSAIQFRTIKTFHVNTYIPNVYEDQLELNLLIVAAGRRAPEPQSPSRHDPLHPQPRELTLTKVLTAGGADLDSPARSGVPTPVEPLQ